MQRRSTHSLRMVYQAHEIHWPLGVEQYGYSRCPVLLECERWPELVPFVPSEDSIHSLSEERPILLGARRWEKKALRCASLRHLGYLEQEAQSRQRSMG